MEQKQELSDVERLKIAREVFDCIFHEFESFEKDNVGAHLAYLLGAIVGEKYGDPYDFVDWSEWPERPAPVILAPLQKRFAADHPLWRFIVLEPM